MPKSFPKFFFHKKVSVYLEDSTTVNGIVIEIGLSAIQNVDSCERLPVSIKVGNTNISLPQIQQILII